MTDDLKSVLLEAVGLAPAEREAFIAEWAGEDEALGARLRGLVSAWDEATTLLRDAGSTPGLGAAVGMGGESAGERVGPFVLEARLGEGGFGVVWRARQETPVRRSVALKILKPGMERSDFVARFELERQALARLTHASIARIYDAGVTANGRPYFAMELVDGEPITAYCDTHRLGLRARIALFRDVCTAVHHAHAKGVIHRDLKPSNILVTEIDGQPVPKVIDFGVAKATDEPLTDLTLVTMARQIVGTPRYMSPEQASLDSTAVDTRSDVYSLGVILYELLCDQAPIPDEALNKFGLADLARALLTAKVERPSARLRASYPVLRDTAERFGMDENSLLRALTGDLDWVAMQAIAPEPAERYASAASLGADLGRWLDGEPVLAHPPSTAYQVRKFARRHKALVLGVSASVLLLVAGVVGTSIGLVRATRAERVANAERDAAEEALAQANSVSDFLENMISSVDPTARGRDVRVVDLLDEAAASVNEQFAGQDAIRSRVLATLARAYWSLGELAKARSFYEEALPIREALYGTDDGVYVGTLANLISVRYQIGDVEGALSASEALLESIALRSGDMSEQYVDALSNYGVFLAQAGRTQDALDVQRRVVDLQRSLRGPSSERTIGAMVNLAVQLRETGDIAGAEATAAAALDAAMEHLGPDHPTTLLLRGNLAVIYRILGDPVDAAAQYEEVLAAQQRVLGGQHPSTLLTARNLASLCMTIDQEERGFELIREILASIPAPIPATHQLATSLAVVFIPPLAADPEWSMPADVAEQLTQVIAANAENASLSFADRDYFVQVLCMVRPEEYRAYELAIAMARENEALARDAGRGDTWSFVETVAFALDAAGRHSEAAAEQRRAIAEADALGVTGADREAMDGRLAGYEGAAGGEGK